MKLKKICFILPLIFIFLLTYLNISKNDIRKNIAVYIDNAESTSIPDKNSNYVIDNIICDNNAHGTWNNDSWGLLITNMTKKTNCKLYFRSKKDIIITYDNNYIKNNIIDDIYDLTSFSTNCVHSSSTKYSIFIKNGFKYYTFMSGDDETSNGGACGFWKKNKVLTADTKYTLHFIAKGNKNFEAFIASEQDPYLYTNWNITTQWKKYSRTFISNSNSYTAFVIYNWLNGSEKRILELTDIELQKGEYDNFSTITLKEYDNLGSTLPTPSRDGYTFLGWFTDPIEGNKISNDTIVSENTTYYAHWQYIE